MEQQIFQGPDWENHHRISMIEEDGVKDYFEWSPIYELASARRSQPSFNDSTDIRVGYFLP